MCLRSPPSSCVVLDLQPFRYMRDVACSTEQPTENNFAAIQDADQLVPRGFIVIKFYQFYE